MEQVVTVARGLPPTVGDLPALRHFPHPGSHDRRSAPQGPTRLPSSPALNLRLAVEAVQVAAGAEVNAAFHQRRRRVHTFLVGWPMLVMMRSVA